MKINAANDFDMLVNDNDAYRRKCIGEYVKNYLQKSHIVNIPAMMEKFGFYKDQNNEYTFLQSEFDEVEKNLYTYAHSLNSGKDESAIYETMLNFGFSIEEIDAVSFMQQQEEERC